MGQIVWEPLNDCLAYALLPPLVILVSIGAFSAELCVGNGLILLYLPLTCLSTATVLPKELVT